jgi:hypothetical protein
MLDSCHDQWFADWYLDRLIPRVHGTVFIQDIAFHDRLEPSTEASHVWAWLRERRIDFLMSGWLERCPAVVAVRSDMPERRRLESNSVFFEWPSRFCSGEPEWQRVTESVESCLAEWKTHWSAQDAERARVYLGKASSLLLDNARRANRARLALKIADVHGRMENAAEANRWALRALAYAISSDRHERNKSLRECRAWAKATGSMRLYLAAGLVEGLTRSWRARGAGR